MVKMEQTASVEVVEVLPQVVLVQEVMVEMELLFFATSSSKIVYPKLITYIYG